MSRYIDADALMERLERKKCEPAKVRYTEGFNDALMRFRSMVHGAPTVDAVPVVRCEKCRKGIKAHGISDGWVLCTKPYVTDTVGAMMHPNDWFCADGERRN